MWDSRISIFIPQCSNCKAVCISFTKHATVALLQWYSYPNGGRPPYPNGDRQYSVPTINWCPTTTSTWQWPLPILWDPWPCHPPLLGARSSTSTPPCTSCRGFSTTGKRPSLVVVGAMPLDTFHYPTSPCSYNLVTPSGRFTLQVSLCFDSTSIQSHALLDSGASTYSIDISFVRAQNIPTVRTIQSISVEAIDGWVLSLGSFVTNILCYNRGLCVNQHVQYIVMVSIS